MYLEVRVLAGMVDVVPPMELGANASFMIFDANVRVRDGSEQHRAAA